MDTTIKNNLKRFSGVVAFCLILFCCCLAFLAGSPCPAFKNYKIENKKDGAILIKDLSGNKSKSYNRGEIKILRHFFYPCFASNKSYCKKSDFHFSRNLTSLHCVLCPDAYTIEGLMTVCFDYNQILGSAFVDDIIFYQDFFLFFYNYIS